MRLERSLLFFALGLMALWSIGVTAAVLRDNQISADMGAAVVLGAVLFPVLLAACMVGLVVWPLLRAMEADAGSPLNSDFPAPISNGTRSQGVPSGRAKASPARRADLSASSRPPPGFARPTHDEKEGAQW